MIPVLPLHEQFCQYSSIFKNNTPRTVKAFQDTFRLFVEEANISTLQEINQTTVEQFLVTVKLQRQWAPKTIINHLQCLSLFLDWCVDRKHIETNCTKAIPKPKLPKRIPKSLSQEQARTLLEWANHYDYYYPFERPRAVCIIAMFLFTGIRLRELYKLEIPHVTLSTRTIMVRSGKGRKDRIIPMNPRLCSIVKEYLQARQQHKKTTSTFFASTKRDQPMGQCVIGRLVKKLRDASGIYFSPHLLRHTFATLMIEGGCDIYSLSKMMGHSDIKTTTIYLSTSVQHLQKQIARHPLCW